MIIFGDNYYGKVDRVPGLFFVRTRFFHVWFIPIVPRESYLFFDDQPGGALAGVRIPLNWKSIMIAWVRGFLVWVAIVWFLCAYIPFEEDRPHLSEKYTPAAMFLGISFLACVSYWGTLCFTKASIDRALALGAILQIPRRVIEEYCRGNKVSFWTRFSDPDATIPMLDAEETTAIRAAIEKKKEDGEFFDKDGQK